MKIGRVRYRTDRKRWRLFQCRSLQQSKTIILQVLIRKNWLMRSSPEDKVRKRMVR